MSYNVDVDNLTAGKIQLHLPNLAAIATEESERQTLRSPYMRLGGVMWYLEFVPDKTHFGIFLKSMTDIQG